jgi:predicted ribosomally synthesized peptide with SipW-like signal peptide
MVLGIVGGLAGGALFAHFTDTETSTENMFIAGDWSTKFWVDIDGTWYDDETQPGGPDPFPEPFPLFGENPNIKPCNGGQQSVSIHLESINPTEQLYIIIRNIVNDEVYLVEPEQAEGDNPDNPANLQDGELASFLWFEFWRDFNDNGVMDGGEPLIWQGYASQFITFPEDAEGGRILPNTPITVPTDHIDYVGVKWHLDQNNGPWSGDCSPWGTEYPPHNPNVNGGGNPGGQNVNLVMTDNYQCIVALAIQ